MFRWQPRGNIGFASLTLKYNQYQHILISYRCLSQFANGRHNEFSCRNYNGYKSSNNSSLTYLRLHKRHLSVSSSPAINRLSTFFMIYALLYLSYKYFIAREKHGPRLQILGNHLYSPFHINSILSLIYPKLLGIFQR